MVYEHLTDVTSHSRTVQKFQAGSLITFWRDLTTTEALSLVRAWISPAYAPSLAHARVKPDWRIADRPKRSSETERNAAPDCGIPLCSTKPTRSREVQDRQTVIA